MSNEHLKFLYCLAEKKKITITNIIELACYFCIMLCKLGRYLSVHGVFVKTVSPQYYRYSQRLSQNEY